MMSRALIYSRSRSEKHPSKMVEFKQLCEHRQHSSEKLRQRIDSKMFSRRANSLQNINARCKDSWKRSGPIETRTISRHTNPSGGNEYWRVTMVGNDAHLGSTQERGRSISNNVLFSGSFIDPIKILPSPGKDYCSDSVNVIMDEVNKGQNKNVRVPEEKFREKKVTFVLETPKKPPCLTAQIRRQNFRNSYSKGSKNKFISRVVDSPVDADGKTENVHQTLDESVDLEIQTTAGEFTGASPRSVQQITSPNNGVDRPKQQQTTKRKLKSCRSRSFHKTLDSSFVHQDALSRFSYNNKKPLKAVHQEVVTMISLVQPEDAEQNSSKTVNTPTEIEISALVDPEDDDDRNKGARIPISTKSNLRDQCITGMMKFTGPNIKGTDFGQPNQEERRNIFASSKGFKFSLIDETSKTSSNMENNASSRVNERQFQSFENQHESKSIFAENQSFEKCAPLQSVKEKECWSSFHKMTKKGLFVSFDTILRGLLTPTEYRLRKDNLSFLAQD